MRSHQPFPRRRAADRQPLLTGGDPPPCVHLVTQGGDFPHHPRVVLPCFRSGLFRSTFAIKKIWQGKEVHRRVSTLNKWGHQHRLSLQSHGRPRMTEELQWLGPQHCSNAYQRRLSKHGIKVSMSGKGHCYDDSIVETAFKSIKPKLIWRNLWDTRHQKGTHGISASQGLHQTASLHSFRGGKSLLAFERTAP